MRFKITACTASQWEAGRAQQSLFTKNFFYYEIQLLFTPERTEIFHFPPEKRMESQVGGWGGAKGTRREVCVLPEWPRRCEMVYPNLTLMFWQAGELLVLLLFLQPAVTVRHSVRREDANKILPLYSGEQNILQPGALPLVWQELLSVRMKKFRERLIQPVEEAKGSAHAGAVFRSDHTVSPQSCTSIPMLLADRRPSGGSSSACP